MVVSPMLNTYHSCDTPRNSFPIPSEPSFIDGSRCHSPLFLDFLQNATVAAWNEWLAHNTHVKIRLQGIDLAGANLEGVNLRNVDLGFANLRGANLKNAVLRYANLRHTDLCGADLSGADLVAANLRDADLSGTCLCGAEVNAEDLLGANLSHADTAGLRFHRKIGTQDHSAPVVAS
ncbi:MAG: hypothetical protein GF418_08260 [Chitinivibrionales bacterium]|nr:hypothetical protein [Chitinivibrionales bacterium]MBD3395606.1 hypothetical protein [Chitinivibrionales bacterium]